MDHDGPGILRVAILDLLEELQHANRGEGHPEVWPAGEVELGDEPLRLLPRHISHLRQKNNLVSTRFLFRSLNSNQC